MPECDQLTSRIRAAGPGLAALLAQARRTWVDRAAAAAPGECPVPVGPVWHPFEDAFPTSTGSPAGRGRA